MQERVWAALDDDSSDHQRYPATRIREYLIDGARLYSAKVGSVQATETITQIPGTALYALPADCVRVLRLTWVSGATLTNSGDIVTGTGTNYPVSPTTMRELDEQMSGTLGWEDDTGTRAEWYYIFGVNQIGLYPKLTTGTQSYLLHYQGETGIIYPYLLDSEQYVPDEDREGLVAYAIARCLAADKNPGDAQAEYAQYAATVKGAKARRSSPDRQVSMGNVTGWQGIARRLP